MMLFSCMQDYVGYGIVLWPRDEAQLPTGSLVGITKNSEIQNTKTIVVLGTENVNNSPLVIDSWRLQEFSGQSDAVKYQTEQAELINLFAMCTKQALPVRAKPDSQADLTYRLRDGETVKIISRSVAPVKEGDIEQFWYQILTDKGVRGWSFGANLEIFSVGQPLADHAQKTFSEKDILSRLSSTTWRPDYFPEMIKNRQYDLRKFSQSYGFFMDMSSKTIRIVTHELIKEGPFGNIIATSEGFLFETLGVEGKFVSDSLIISFLHEEKPKEIKLVPVKQDLRNIIGEENARRQAIFRKLSTSSNGYESPINGILTFQGTRFSWTDNSAIRGSVIPAQAGTAGSINLDVYLGEGDNQGYQSVFGLHFDGMLPEQTVYFAYTISNQGLSLLKLAAENLKLLSFDTIPADGNALTFTRRL